MISSVNSTIHSFVLVLFHLCHSLCPILCLLSCLILFVSSSFVSLISRSLTLILLLFLPGATPNRSACQTGTYQHTTGPPPRISTILRNSLNHLLPPTARQHDTSCTNLSQPSSTRSNTVPSLFLVVTEVLFARDSRHLSPPFCGIPPCLHNVRPKTRTAYRTDNPREHRTRRSIHEVNSGQAPQARFLWRNTSPIHQQSIDITTALYPLFSSTL